MRQNYLIKYILHLKPKGIYSKKFQTHFLKQQSCLEWVAVPMNSSQDYLYLVDFTINKKTI